MKCRVRGFLKNSEKTIPYDTIGIYQEEKNFLTWKEQDALNTTISLDFEKKQLIRDNKELKIILTFAPNKDTIMNCKLKDMNRWIDLKVKIISQKETENEFSLVYETYLDQDKIDQFILQVERFNQDV